MSSLTTTDDIKQLGTILGIWAHPDDETMSCGGIMAAAVQNGQQVICITATKGEAGVQDESRWPADQLGDIRANELKKACEIIGVTKHHWLGYGDGQCDAVDVTQAAEKIREFITQYNPDTILTFGPEGMTGHPDHQAVSRWVDAARKGTNIAIYHSVLDEDMYERILRKHDERFNWFFNIDKPPLKPSAACDIGFKLNPDLIHKKHQALIVMPSQYASVFKQVPDFVEQMLTCECFIEA